jgi:4-carboxymuconolactone decarboxylase
VRQPPGPVGPAATHRPPPAASAPSLITSGSTEQLHGHLDRARRNGLTETELKEAIIHLAFYAGWPKATSAVTVAKQVFRDRTGPAT